MKIISKILIALILIFFLTQNTIAQEDDQEPIPPTWNLSLSTPQPFINEDIRLNVTGVANRSFEIKFESILNNYSFKKYGFTDQNGEWEGMMKFKLGENGTYIIKLLVDNEVVQVSHVEAIYNEQQAQWLTIYDLEDEDDKIWHKINEVIRLQNNQLRLYKKWLSIFFLLWAFQLCVIWMLLKYLWPIMVEDYYRWKKHRKESRRVENVFSTKFRGYDYEFFGYSNQEPTMTIDDPAIIQDSDVGKTKFQLLLERMEQYQKIEEEKDGVDQ